MFEGRDKGDVDTEDDVSFCEVLEAGDESSEENSFEDC